ncbi:MAG: hypothetical protein HC923_02465 [Myxococcales bacterium]|nr:hypothetical protein [Myxococcales bacterium]
MNSVPVPRRHHCPIALAREVRLVLGELCPGILALSSHLLAFAECVLDLRVELGALLRDREPLRLDSELCLTKICRCGSKIRVRFPGRQGRELEVSLRGQAVFRESLDSLELQIRDFLVGGFGGELLTRGLPLLNGLVELRLLGFERGLEQVLKGGSLGVERHDLSALGLNLGSQRFHLTLEARGQVRIQVLNDDERLSGDDRITLDRQPLEDDPVEG